MSKRTLEVQAAWRKHIDSNHKEGAFREFVEQMQSFHSTECGDEIQFISVPMAIDSRDFLELEVACKEILRIQSKVIGALKACGEFETVLRKMSMPKCIDYFGSDGLDAAGDVFHMARLDLVIDGEGEYKLCEINADSSIGGMEAFRCALEWSRSFSPGYRGSNPCRVLASEMSRYMSKMGLKKLVVMDWGSWAGKYFSLDELMRCLRSEIGEESVYFRDEKSAFEILDSETLVYRVFLWQDVGEDLEWIKRLYSTGAKIFMGPISEVMSSKYWLHLFHDSGIQDLLSPDEVSLIRQWIPMSFSLDPDDDSSAVEKALRDKDRYVFKEVSGYGGKGVIIGKSHSLDVIRESLGKGVGWIAQEFVAGASISTPEGYPLRWTDQRWVLGVYVIGASSCGPMIRACESSLVVNVSGGAQIGWAIPLAESEFGDAVC